MIKRRKTQTQDQDDNKTEVIQSKIFKNPKWYNSAIIQFF